VGQPDKVALLRWLVPLVLVFLGLFLFPFLAHEGIGFWGAGVCHRITERSFVIAGLQLPLCARCTGIYLGFLTTVVVCFLRGRRRPAILPPRGIVALLVLFLAIVGVDGMNSYISLFPTLPHLYEPHNTLRLLTGTLEGIALAGFLWPVLHMSLWQFPQEQRSIPNLRELGLILLAALGLDLVVLWQPPISSYPLAVLSVAGVLLALGIVGTLLVSVITRRAGRVTSWPQVAVLFAWGCFVALLEMAGMAWVRYALIGSFTFSLAGFR
jgi:uncharacterized membrane protein